MPGCSNRCITITSDTLEGQWEEIRNHYGPRPSGLTAENRAYLLAKDIGDWRDATAETVPFAKWLQWYFATGSMNYGNLSTRRRGHKGITCMPCPYDLNAPPVRVDIMLKGVTPTQSDHGSDYMKTAARGSVWGYECTHDNCPYFLANGQRYFYA